MCALHINPQAQNVKSVSEDLWNMTYDFVRDVKADLSGYDDDGSWPGTHGWFNL